MVDVNGAALGKCDRVAHFDSVLHNLYYVSDVVVALQCLQHSLHRLDVAVQPQTLRLQPLDALLVVTQFGPHLVKVGAGNGCQYGNYDA